VSVADELLDTCGCCAGVTPATPSATANPPGQASLAYRVGTHARFKANMLAAIGRQSALAGLATRADDDPSVALMDAFATTLDVLTFYNERFANEGYLRTATERRSVLELARAIGYELAPGVAASTYLAFTLEETPGAPQSITIEAGAKAQSIPGQDELPQVFETNTAIEARPAWNAMQPQLTARTQPKPGDTALYLAGLATNLRPGDAILFVHASGATSPLPVGDSTARWQMRRLLEVTAENEAGRTRIRWGGALNGNASPATTVHALRTRAALFGHNAPPSPSITAIDKIYAQYQGDLAIFQESAEVFALQAVQNTADASIKVKIALPEDAYSAGTSTVNLDMVYGQVVASDGSDRRYAVLVTPSQTSVFEITAVAEESVAEYTMSGKTTRLTLNANVPSVYNRRNTTVFCQSEWLPVAEAPLGDPLPRNAIVLDRIVDGLVKGQRLAFTGKAFDTSGALSTDTVSEIAELSAADVSAGRTRLTLAAELAHDYQRTSARINGNVAPATHGETRLEVLGSGDASQPLQSFTLRQTPLTCVRATNAAGAASTLRIRVNGVLWDETPALYGAPRDDTVYIVRLGDDGKAVVTFGDGERGRRLPTGSENVKATYRVGTGEAGLVKANQISLLGSRPLGVKEVINPTAPEGAENPETLDTARDNAPLRVLTLDRVVSLTDFENFARAYGGIAKARAVWLWDGERRLVHITLAAPRAQPVAADSDLGRALRAALDSARHPDIQVRFGAMDLRRFAVHARVKVDPRRETEVVRAAVKAHLAEVFSFERMHFAESVAASRVLAEMQSVVGVIAVDLDALFVLPASTPTKSMGLPALGARWAGGAIAADQLLAIDAAAIELTEFVP
jgi:predicted phage baseplate assembly protein